MRRSILLLVAAAAAVGFGVWSTAAYGAPPTGPTIISTPRPNRGDATFAQFVVTAPRAPSKRFSHLRLVYRNKTFPNDLIAINSIVMDPRGKGMYDVTIGMFRGIRDKWAKEGIDDYSFAWTSAAGSIADFCAAGPCRPIQKRVYPKVVQGNFVQPLLFEDGFDPSHVKFFLGSHPGFPAASDSLAYLRGLSLDQTWVPLSFPTSLGASFCEGQGDPAGATIYNFTFACNKPFTGVGVEFLDKTLTITAASIDQGMCYAVNTYTAFCRPPSQVTTAPLRIGLDKPLLTGYEVGGGPSFDGRTVGSFFPIREKADVSSALRAIDQAITTDSQGQRLLGSIRSELVAIGAAASVAQVCRELQVLQEQLPHIALNPGTQEAFTKDVRDSVKALGCSEGLPE